MIGLTGLPISSVAAAAYTVPTDAPESDGTLEWDSTTIVLATVDAGGEEGLGYTYGAAAAGGVIQSVLGDAVRGSDAFDIPAAWEKMRRALRNIGRPGIGAMAVSAVDTALWDLKARLLGLPLIGLLGAERESIPVYGSGGFTSYDDRRLAEQMSDWAAIGLPSVKMKVGREPGKDAARVARARKAIGDGVELFVDANGAYAARQAAAQAGRFADQGVSWFEEPVSSDHLEGLAALRGRVPGGMEIAAGEYGFDAFYFRRMLDAGAVDVLQADATRCGGYTGFLQAAALCESRGVPLSAHTAPALHLPVCCAAPRVRHLEYFHDHVRVERLLFDGVVEPRQGRLTPDRGRPGHGLALKKSDAERYRVW